MNRNFQQLLHWIMTTIEQLARLDTLYCVYFSYSLSQSSVVFLVIFRSRLPTEGWNPGPILSDVGVCHSVCLSLCLSVVGHADVYIVAKTAGPIEMPFGMRGGVGHSNTCIRWGFGPPTGRGSFGGFHPIEKHCA